jgi:hypothetical protein
MLRLWRTGQGDPSKCWRQFTNRDEAMFEKARLISANKRKVKYTEPRSTAINVCRYDADCGIALAAISSICAYAGSNLDLHVCMCY